MPMLDDIEKSDAWIVECFRTEGIELDHSINSVQNIEDFFVRYSSNGEATPGSPLSQALGPVCFGIAAYVGNTLIKNVGGTWNVNEDDESGIEVKLKNGKVCWPVQRVMKRFKNGPEENIYHYARVVGENDS